MSKFVLTDATAFRNGYDMSCDVNQIEVTAEVDVVEQTTFCDAGWRTMLGGLKSASYSMNGFYEAGTGTVDEELAAITTSVDTFTPDGSDGAVAYFMQSQDSGIQRFGSVGDITPINMTGVGRSTVGLLRGNLLLEKQTVSGDTDGTGLQMGAVSATESLYTVIHCFSAGTTADVIVESDDNAGFTSATERSSTTITAAGGTWVTAVAGAITDDYWRVSVDTVTGSFSLAVAVAIA